MAAVSEFEAGLSAGLETLKEKHLYRSLPGVERSLADFSSNDYLGLSKNSSVLKAAAAAVRREGAGSGASRLISGNRRVHEELEKKIARFKHEEAALVFSSGYLANIGAVTSLVGEGDVVLFDRLNHASLVDAARLSGAKFWPYPHKDVDRLRELLSRAGGFRRRLVVTDAYFSMDGDVAPLDRLLETCEERGAWLMIDEAHSTGVFGALGRGLTERFGLEGRVHVVMGTLSKALGSAGGFVAGSSLLKETLVNRARSFIYTTAPVPAASAAALASLEWIEAHPAKLKAFWKSIASFRSALEGEGFDLMGSEGPIVPVLVGDPAKTLAFRDALAREGFHVGAVRPPTVPRGTDRLRISLKATHSPAELRALASTLVKTGRRLA